MSLKRRFANAPDRFANAPDLGAFAVGVLTHICGMFAVTVRSFAFDVPVMYAKTIGQMHAFVNVMHTLCFALTDLNGLIEPPNEFR